MTSKILAFIKLKRKYVYLLIGIIILFLVLKYVQVPQVSLFEKQSSLTEVSSGQRWGGSKSLFTTEMDVAGSTSAGVQEQEIDRKVIKTASLEIETKDFLTDFNKIISLTQSYGGFLSSSSARVENDVKVGALTIRLPADKFYSILSEIEELGEVKSKQVSGQDVTEEYIDLQARLKNARATEQRLLEILNKANTVDEILKVEGELNNIRERIEQFTGRIKYLENAVDLATITINIHEPTPAIKKSSWFIDSLKSSIEALVTSISKIIVFIGFILPYAIFLLLIYIIYKSFKRRY